MMPRGRRRSGRLRTGSISNVRSSSRRNSTRLDERESNSDAPPRASSEGDPRIRRRVPPKEPIGPSVRIRGQPGRHVRVQRQEHLPARPQDSLTETHHTGLVTTSGELKRARASFATRSWGDAHKKFEAADATTPLEIEDLEKLAIAAYLSGSDEESTLAWTRAHHQAIERDDPRRAARNAVAIGSGLLFRGETAPAMGWFARGARVLEGCGDCAERAWLLTWNAFVQMWGGDPESAQRVFAESLVVGQRFNDSDLVTMSRLGEGMCLLLQGEVPRACRCSTSAWWA